LASSKPLTKLYFAYGMNTNREEMAYRCPGARALGTAQLAGYRLEFKNYATIVPSPKESVEGVLWSITESDEWALDMLEGYPEFYQKITVAVTQNDIKYIAMTYIMTPREQGHAPSDSYYNMVSEGYQSFGLSQQQLLEAKSRSIKDIVIYE
jgi:gamma-glutamylcyclotransferase